MVGRTLEHREAKANCNENLRLALASPTFGDLNLREKLAEEEVED